MERMLEVGILEYSNTMVVREKMKIDLEHWPELNGMSNEEAIKYIQGNSHKMKPTKDSEEWAESLHDELMDMEIIRDKEYGYSTEIYND